MVFLEEDVWDAVKGEENGEAETSPSSAYDYNWNGRRRRHLRPKYLNVIDLVVAALG
jgi:hypothetical protein